MNRLYRFWKSVYPFIEGFVLCWIVLIIIEKIIMWGK